MNWNAVSALSEAVGSLAVVISVAYLAIQIRKQTHESLLAATRELAAQFQDALKAVTADEKFAVIWLKAVQDYDALENVDRIRASTYFQRICRIMEQQHLHRMRRNLDPAFFESIDLGFKEFLTFPGVQRWWELSNDNFASSFKARAGQAAVRSAGK